MDIVCNYSKRRHFEPNVNKRDRGDNKWYRKVVCANDKRLPFVLSSLEWDKVKCKGCPRKSWLAQVASLKKELELLVKSGEFEVVLRRIWWLHS